MGKILFIVEGENDEINFIKRFFSVCKDFGKCEIVPYKTNLHTFAKRLFENGEIDEDFDIQLFLKEKEKNLNLRKILSENYSDIFLIFDFEPHQDYPHFDLIRKMALHFNDSIQNGKLYINYPMMQSYRHFDKLPNENFKNLTISKNEAKHYKEIVHCVSKFKNVDKHTYKHFISFAYHHLLKLNYILNGKWQLPNILFARNINQVDLFDKQLNLLNEYNYIYVINTFILYLIEFNPTIFYNQITKHKSNYLIS